MGVRDVYDKKTRSSADGVDSGSMRRRKITRDWNLCGIQPGLASTAKTNAVRLLFGTYAA